MKTEAKAITLDDFTRAYILAAFWTNDDEAPSGDYEQSGRFDVMLARSSVEAIEKMAADCAKFQAENEKLLCVSVSRNAEMGGHDFWLTRNHHGSGFWDSDYWAEDTGKALTKASHAFGNQDLYIGDDGLLYVS